MYRIGIDLGGTNTVAGLVDSQGKILDTRAVKTNLPTTLDTIVQNIQALTQQIMEANGLSRQQIASIGVGVPCTADPKSGWMLDADHLGFPGGALVERLEAALQLPVAIGNDANCAAWGEYKAGGYDCSSLILITLGTGIGGGIIVDGKLIDGVNHAAGEVGHMMLYAGGEQCTCGRKGCFEAHGSATALIRRARAVTGETITEAKTVFDRAVAGDAVYLSILEEYTECLADGCANLINIFAPDVLCIGGGISAAGEQLMGPVREKTLQRIYAKNARENTRIEPARLQNDAGIIGAAWLEK